VILDAVRLLPLQRQQAQRLVSESLQ